jgi:hypothetical protein
MAGGERGSELAVGAGGQGRVAKPRASFRVPPNMPDYDAARRDFDWGVARAGL